MKRFIVSILCVATFFIGLGGLIESVGAKFKSDERALELVRQARIAIGGEQSIANVRSLTITGRATKTFDFDGNAKTEQGEWELNLQMPNQLSKSMKLRREGTEAGAKIENVEKEIFIVRQGELKDKMVAQTEGGGDKKRVAFMVKKDGENEKVIVNGAEGANNVENKKIFIDKVAGGADDFHQNEIFRTTLALLLTPPQGVDVGYRYLGEGAIDTTNCDIIEATTGNSTVKLYLDKTSHLPVAMTYQAPKPFVIKIRKEEAKGAEANSDVKILREKMPAPEMAEFQVKFSDYRTVSGLQLPHSWTQSVAGKVDETIEVSSYELNPAGIADKFKAEPTRVFVRTMKPQ